MTTQNAELVRVPAIAPANAPLPPPGTSLIDDILSAPFDVEKAKQRLAKLEEFFRAVMKPDEDYGPAYKGSKAIILYRGGGDKMCQFLGVVQRPKVTDKIEQWALEGGLPFFHFQLESELVSLRSGQIVAVGMGSCNSREVKYRYRNAERKCPECSNAAIIPSKFEDRRTGKKGWYCLPGKGGCGNKFEPEDRRITQQEVGRIENTEIADLHHTILRVAKKRANGDSIVTISRAIGFMVAGVKDDKHDQEDGDDDEPPTGADDKSGGKTDDTKAKAADVPMCTEDERKNLHVTASKAGHSPEEVRAWFIATHEIDPRLQNIPKAIYDGALERLGKDEKLVEAVA
jgi:hypothetical protein